MSNFNNNSIFRVSASTLFPLLAVLESQGFKWADGEAPTEWQPDWAVHNGGDSNGYIFIEDDGTITQESLEYLDFDAEGYTNIGWVVYNTSIVDEKLVTIAYTTVAA